MPMIGSKEIFTESENSVRVPQTMFVYMICIDQTACNTSGWADTGYFTLQGSLGYVNISESTSLSPQRIYLRIVAAGTYMFGNLGGAYLFDDDMSGKSFIIKHYWKYMIMILSDELFNLKIILT